MSNVQPDKHSALIAEIESDRQDISWALRDEHVDLILAALKANGPLDASLKRDQAVSEQIPDSRTGSLGSPISTTSSTAKPLEGATDIDRTWWHNQGADACIDRMILILERAEKAERELAEWKVRFNGISDDLGCSLRQHEATKRELAEAVKRGDFWRKQAEEWDEREADEQIEREDAATPSASRQTINDIQRYDLEDVGYRESHYSMEPDCDGPYVKYEDVAAVVSRIKGAAVAEGGKPHWVFAAAESHRNAVDCVESGPFPHQRWHLLEMLDTIKAGMSPTKACRWLGWVQACIFFDGVKSLEELKAINKAASDAHSGPEQSRG